MDKIREFEKLQGQEINEAKKVLAFEITKLVHGEEEALKCQNAASAIFENGALSDNMPCVELSQSDIQDNAIDIISLLVKWI